MVMAKRIQKYISKIGQKTGISNTLKKLHTSAMAIAFVVEYQNLNSGSLRINGLNSSSALVGREGPSSARPPSVVSTSALSKEGSNFG